MAYETGYDWSESVQKVAMLRWDTVALSWVKLSGGTGTGPDVTVVNFPATYPITTSDPLWVRLMVSSPTVGAVTQGGAWDIRLIASSATVGTVNAAQSGTWDVRSIASSATIGTVNAAQSGGWDTRLIASSATVGAVTQGGGFDVRLIASSATQAISAVSLPLPSGASTEATLSTLNGKVTACNTSAVSITAALPAGANLIGGFYGVCGQLIDETGTLRTVNRAFVNATLIGNTEVVATQGGAIRIRVLAVTFVALSAATVKFQSATTDISAGFPIGINGGVAIPYNPHGLFQTAANEALNINLSLGVTVGCQVTWVQAT